MDHATFARLLRDWRERNGYSQRDAAEVLRVPKPSLQNWEQQRAMPQGFGLQAMLDVISPKRGRKEFIDRFSWKPEHLEPVPPKKRKG